MVSTDVLQGDARHTMVEEWNCTTLLIAHFNPSQTNSDRGLDQKRKHHRHYVDNAEQ
jgi:hypothetical protein